MIRKLVKPSGPIYDLTPLDHSTKESEDRGAATKAQIWERIFTRQHPDIKWAHQWIGDLSKDSIGDETKDFRLLFYKDEDDYIFSPHRSMFHFTSQNGLLDMGIWQGRISDEWKDQLQKKWPGKIIIIIARRFYADGKIGNEFGATTFEDLNLVTPELTAEDILWEKRHLLKIEKRAAADKLAEAEAGLAALER